MSFLCALDQQGFIKFVVTPQLLPQINMPVYMNAIARFQDTLRSLTSFDCPRIPIDKYDLQGPEWWALEVCASSTYLC
jgi:hypothetical protein